jgi:microcystin-dependent protein
MCQKCQKSSCKGCSKSGGSDIAQLANQLAELQASVDAISDSTKYLRCGHPIIMLQAPDDILAFDVDTGLGSGCFENWAVCNGQVQYSPTDGKNFQTPNLLNNFIVAAGDTYRVDATGGVNSVTLSLPQIPSHTHTITDPGHNHGVTDPGHTHSGSSAAHNHTLTDPGHNHTVTNTMALNKNIPYAHFIDDTLNVDSGSGNDVPDTWTQQEIVLTGSVSLASSQTGITVASATTTVTVASAYTGVTTNSNTTGITAVNAGGGESHENRPPYYALLFAIKL